VYQLNSLCVLWYYSPFQFVPGRLGSRRYHVIPQTASQNRAVFFA
jgi:hypothetical protein